MLAALTLRRAARTEWLVLTVVLTLLSAGLGAINGLGRPDNTLYDAAQGLLSRAAPDDIVIIAIDEASLATLGRWPWPRATHARLLERLAGAKPRAVGLDLILTEAEPQGDAALARALAGVPTVLPIIREQRAADGFRTPHLAGPVPELSAAAAALAHIHVEVDADGIARSVFLREGLHMGDLGIRTWPHFSWAMLATGHKAMADATPPGRRNPRPPGAGQWTRDFWMHIPFTGPPGSIARESYADVLSGKVEAGRFAGKYVLVGATAVGLGDAYPTPVSGHSRLMPGVEISANVLAALRQNRAIVVATPWVNALFNGLPVLLLMLGLRRLGPRRGLLLTTALLLTLPALAGWGLSRGTWLAPCAGLLGLALSYPLWSWRRLEATVAFLGAEFGRLAAEPRVLPESDAVQPAGTDVVEARMLALAGAADRLRNLRRFVSDTLDSLPDAALVTDRDGAVLIANRAAARLLVATAPETLRGRMVGDLSATLTAPDRDALPPTWEQLKQLGRDAAASAGGAAPSIECATREGRDLLARCALVNDATGELAGWIVAFADVSELREAERSREEVLAFLSHDMRSPQTSILALLELHAMDPDDNPVETVHQRIEQYARRTLSLSEGFLQLARAETKAHETTVEDLGVLVEEAVDDVWAAAEQKSIKVRIQWDGEPVPVNADRALLLRAIINLLTNAVKYSPADTTVSVTVAMRNEDGVEVCVCEVADQGYGISAENQAKLFERFRRFSEPGQPTAHGAGLGMAFVKTVIEKHEGRIDVKSATGAGSVFTLVLPSV